MSAGSKEEWLLAAKSTASRRYSFDKLCVETGEADSRSHEQSANTPLDDKASCMLGQTPALNSRLRLTMQDVFKMSNQVNWRLDVHS